MQKGKTMKATFFAVLFLGIGLFGGLVFGVAMSIDQQGEVQELPQGVARELPQPKKKLTRQQVMVDAQRKQYQKVLDHMIEQLEAKTARC